MDNCQFCDKPFSEDSSDKLIFLGRGYRPNGKLIKIFEIKSFTLHEKCFKSLHPIMEKAVEAAKKQIGK